LQLAMGGGTGTGTRVPTKTLTTEGLLVAMLSLVVSIKVS